MQSSSGCEEEYDSLAESSISAFLNNQPPPSHVGVGLGPFISTSTITNLPNTHTLPPQHHHNNTHMFDPSSNYLDPMQRSPSLPNSNSLLNLDMLWSKPARSQPNPTDLGGLIPCSSSSPPQQDQPLLSNQMPGQTRDTSTFLTTHNALPLEGGSRGLVTVSAANNDQPHSTNTNAVRNPKKRSRASRRAPTTVLTTDTTNFRAMVQEFTGIPAPPFTSTPFPRSRLDLFGSAVTSTVRSTHLDPPYLLRPFAQKFHNLNPFPPTTSSFPPSSSMDTLLASNNSTNNSTTNSTSINYHISSTADHLGLLKQPSNFNTHNPILSFQNILRPPQKYPLGNPSVHASKTQPSLEIPSPSGGDPHLRMGVLEELGLRHAQVNTNVSGLHQNMVSSPSVGLGTLSSGNNNLSNASTEWAQGMGTITNNDCYHGEEVLLRSLGGSNIAERVTNGKVHYSASSSDFHGEKGPDCTVAARNQGMLESWVNCSSDLVLPPKD